MIIKKKNQEQEQEILKENRPVIKQAPSQKKVAKEVEIENLMLETDCPYLAPHPFRGVENSPKYIGFVAKEIANLRNISYDSVVQATTKNAKEFFNLR